MGAWMLPPYFSQTLQSKFRKKSTPHSQEEVLRQRSRGNLVYIYIYIYIGSNLDVDVPYHYLTFFLEDDDKLAEIKDKYGKGELLSGEVKNILISLLQVVVKNHQVPS